MENEPNVISIIKIILKKFGYVMLWAYLVFDLSANSTQFTARIIDSNDMMRCDSICQ